MRLVIDAGALARAIGDQTGHGRAPGELAEVVVPFLDISPYLLASEGSVQGSDFTPVGSGRIRTIVFGNIGLGTDFSFTVPDGVAWSLQMLFARFVAAAVAATRIPRVVFQNVPGDEICRIPAVWSALSGQSIISTWAKGINSRQSTGGLLEFGTDVPNEVLLGPGYKILSSTSGLQAGDQWQGVALHVREYAV